MEHEQEERMTDGRRDAEEEVTHDGDGQSEGEENEQVEDDKEMMEEHNKGVQDGQMGEEQVEDEEINEEDDRQMDEEHNEQVKLILTGHPIKYKTELEANTCEISGALFLLKTCATNCMCFFFQ